MNSVDRLQVCNSKTLILTANYTNSNKLIRENLCNLWLKTFLEADNKSGKYISLNYFRTNNENDATIFL